MRKAEIEQRLETLDKVEADWIKWKFLPERPGCEMCYEDTRLGGPHCGSCTCTLALPEHCWVYLREAEELLSVRPILDAISKMRTWLKKQENL